jgi:hypothetical protein
MSKFSDRLKDFLWAVKKDRRLQLGFGVALVLIIAGVGWVVFGRSGTSPRTALAPTININTNSIVSTEDAPTQIRRFTDGVMVHAGKENLRPRAVMIENLVTIRPQRGLSQANVVYEALAEGGITRFLAIFSSDSLPKEIGPVRSARPYFVHLANEFQSVYFHAGGSPQAVSLLRDVKTIEDVDSILGGGPYFQRQKIERATEHNLFINPLLIALLFRDRAVKDEGTFEPWKFKSDPEVEDRPVTEQKIVIDFSSFSYEVEYRYDRTGNRYLRWNGGEPLKDELNGEQISSKNVVVQYVNTKSLGDGKGRLDMTLLGEGRAQVFQDGKAIEATWRKEGANGRTRFMDANDEEIRFNAGSTWVEVIPTDRTVTITP